MSLAVTLCLAFIAIVLFLRWHIIDRYSYFQRRNILHIRPKFPEGNFQGVIMRVDAVNWVMQQYLRFRGRDKLCGHYFGTSPAIMVTDLDTAYDILVHDFKAFPFAHGQWNDPLANNLYTMEGEQWRTIRTKLSPVFSAMSTRSVLDSLQPVIRDLVAFVDKHADRSDIQLNVRDVFTRYISDAISTSVLGLQTAALREENHPLMNIAERIYDSQSKCGTLLIYFIVSYSAIIKKLRLRIFPADISDYFIGTMDEAMNARVASNDAPRNDLLDLLVRIEQAGCLTDDETGEVLAKITHNQLLGHAFMTYLLGFMSSRVAVNFALFELARNEDIQNKLRTEVLETFPGDQEITYDGLENMPYLQQVVDETLRKYAPAPWIERRAKMDYKVRNSNHVIEKGMKVIIPVSGYHNDPFVYKNPEKFNPDRMTKEKIRKRHPCSFMPFGIGNRVCMAQRVGYLYVKLAIVVLLRKFSFTVSERTEEPLAFEPYTIERIPTAGLWLNVKRLEQAESDDR